MEYENRNKTRNTRIGARARCVGSLATAGRARGSRFTSGARWGQGCGEGRVIRGRERRIEHLHNATSGRKGEGEGDRDAGRYRRGNGPRVDGNGRNRETDAGEKVHGRDCSRCNRRPKWRGRFSARGGTRRKKGRESVIRAKVCRRER